jgi:AcrR family transcriptional regulator
LAAPTSRAPLSRDRVLAAAVDLADREGLQAVTMRHLAADLGVEAMSLYHHLPGKNALLDGLVDAVLVEVGEATAALPHADEWRTSVRQRCLAARTVMLNHPWAPALIGSRTTIPPSVYGHFEAILATMVEGGLSYHLAHRGIHALGSMALGFVQELFSPTASGGTADVDLAEEELAAMADTLPHLSAMVASEIHDHDEDMLGWCDSQAEFEFTLDLLLDGLARQAG